VHAAAQRHAQVHHIPARGRRLPSVQRGNKQRRLPQCELLWRQSLCGGGGGGAARGEVRGGAADRRVITYSIGMMRRIDIAAALVVSPKVLFLDEPTTGLDPRSRRAVWDTVASLSAQGTTVLLTTQYLEEADALSDSIVVIDHGRVIANGTAEELKRRVGFSYCTVSPVNPADLSRIWAAVADLKDAQSDDVSNTVSVPAPDGVVTFAEVFRRVDQIDVELADISLRKPSLDEVFLHLTGNVST
jgi:ABC-2 type transport system ATP-binding protein